MNDCVEAPGCRNSSGYATSSVRGRAMLAHRAAWEKAHGPIPAGMFVLHRCDNRGCVNPDHLWLGTQADNVRDMHAKGRWHREFARKTHCPRGHSYAEHGYYDKTNSPHCRVCDAARHREARHGR